MGRLVQGSKKKHRVPDTITGAFVELYPSGAKGMTAMRTIVGGKWVPGDGWIYDSETCLVTYKLFPNTMSQAAMFRRAQQALTLMGFPPRRGGIRIGSIRETNQRIALIRI